MATKKKPIDYPEKLDTAIIMTMPPDVQRIAVPLLSRYASHTLNLYAAHLTVLFPFVPFDQLEDACATLKTLCATLPSFSVTLDGYGYFPRVIYMRPVDVQPLIAFFRAIYAAFPEYPPYENAFGDDIQPHVTVAIFDSPTARKAAQMPDYEPITFTVDRLSVIYGSHEAAMPFTTYDIIHLSR